jgi:hypothetical protein
MTTPDRRDIVKAAAWSIPVIAIAVSTPLAAASEAPASAPLANRLSFTNVTATVGAKPNTIYFNTKVLVSAGQPVTNIMVAVSLSRDGQTQVRTFPYTAGYGNTGLIELEFPGIPKGAPVTVAATAWADGVAKIDGHDTVVTPSWWR